MDHIVLSPYTVRVNDRSLATDMVSASLTNVDLTRVKYSSGRQKSNRRKCSFTINLLGIHERTVWLDQCFLAFLTPSPFNGIFIWNSRPYAHWLDILILTSTRDYVTPACPVAAICTPVKVQLLRWTNTFRRVYGDLLYCIDCAFQLFPCCWNKRILSI